MRRPRVYYGWLVLAAAFIVMLLGYAMRNTFTVFYPVIVQDFGWTRGVTAIMYSLTLLSYGFVAPVAGGLVDRFNPKFTLAAGSLIVGSGIALCSMATEVWHFYLLYGVVVAIGLSFIGVTPLSAIITNWFPKRKGFVFGLLGAGFGVSLVSAPVFQYLISRFGWQTAYVIIGAAATIIIMPLVLLFIRRMPTVESAGTVAVDPLGSLSAGDSYSAAAHISTDWTVRKALTTRTFRTFLTISFCNMGLAPQIVLAHQVYFLQDLGYTPMSAATVFGVFGMFFATGNVCSFLSDRFGRTHIFIGGGVLASIGVILLILFQNSPGVTIAIVFAVCAGFGLGIAPMTGYAAVADRFHGRHYGSIQGTMILAASLGGAIGPWLGGMLHDTSGNYQGALTIVVCVLLTGNLLMWLIRPGKGDVPV
ncbi:MAG: MFS transporter [Dehalococcoidia bacterium]|nr:MFS transporter [Dehalococcoidia bacterium]